MNLELFKKDENKEISLTSLEIVRGILKRTCNYP